MSETPTAQQNPDGSDDLDLVHRSQTGDLAAYEELVRRYHGRIYGFTYNMTGNRENAAALSRIIFSKAWNALGHFYAQAGFPFWIDRIAFHQSVKFCKKNKRRSAVSFEEFTPAVKQSEAYMRLSGKGSVLRKMSLKEFQAKLNETLLALPHRHRATLILHDMQGYSPLEVARLMSGTEGPAQSRLIYAREKIQSEFECSESERADLLALKAYARPDAARAEKNVENTLRAVCAAHKRPSLNHFPDKSLGWIFAQPRYGVAALFLLFLGLHLLERPMPKPAIKADSFLIGPSGSDAADMLSTNLPPDTAFPGLVPSANLGVRDLGDFMDRKK